MKRSSKAWDTLSCCPALLAPQSQAGACVESLYLFIETFSADSDCLNLRSMLSIILTLSSGLCCALAQYEPSCPSATPYLPRGGKWCLRSWHLWNHQKLILAEYFRIDHSKWFCRFRTDIRPWSPVNWRRRCQALVFVRHKYQSITTQNQIMAMLTRHNTKLGAVGTHDAAGRVRILVISTESTHGTVFAKGSTPGRGQALTTRPKQYE